MIPKMLLVFLCMVVQPTHSMLHAPASRETCSYKGFPLQGRIQFVESFPDIKIKVVTSFPDLRVKLVDAFADECGEWQVVDAFPDVKVQVVEVFEDLRVQYVSAFPGMD